MHMCINTAYPYDYDTSDAIVERLWIQKFLGAAHFSHALTGGFTDESYFLEKDELHTQTFILASRWPLLT